MAQAIPVCVRDCKGSRGAPAFILDRKRKIADRSGRYRNAVAAIGRYQECVVAAFAMKIIAMPIPKGRTGSRGTKTTCFTGTRVKTTR